jgi:hypothetical protein
MLLMTGGTAFYLFQGVNCASFGVEALMEAIDFSFIFDCNNGAIGGVVRFDQDIDLTERGGSTNSVGPLFGDCTGADDGTGN